MKDNIFDIRASKLQKASPIIAAALEEIYHKYGRDTCLTLMMWYTAKGIIYSDLTEAGKDELLAKCLKSLEACYGVINNLK